MYEKSCVFMYVCMCVCVRVGRLDRYMCVCMYVCMSVCTYDLRKYVCMYACRYLYVYARNICCHGHQLPSTPEGQQPPLSDCGSAWASLGLAFLRSAHTPSLVRLPVPDSTPRDSACLCWMGSGFASS